MESYDSPLTLTVLAVPDNTHHSEMSEDSISQPYVVFNAADLKL